MDNGILQKMTKTQFSIFIEAKQISKCKVPKFKIKAVDNCEKNNF